MPEFRTDGTLAAPRLRWDPALAYLPMQVTVLTIDGRAFVYSLWGDATLGTLKALVAASTGTPADTQIIRAGGRRLRNDAALLLRDYGIMPDDSLCLMLSM